MNTAIFWRLVWKEYRQQRALWTAIALAGLMIQVAVLLYCSLNGVPDLSNKLFTVALSVPALYSLGCGAALFAGEHEAGTFSFQQSLPVSAGRVFFAKFVFATVSALLLFPVLWLLAFAMTSWQLPDATWHLQLWGGGVVGTVEVLIWAVLGSLVLRRVLPAAVVSGVTAALLGYGSLVLIMTLGDHFPRQANEYFSTLPLRTGFALLALAIASKFGRRWFDEHSIRWNSPATQRRRSNVATQRPATPATWITVLTRLLWHEARQARTTMLWCVLGYVVLGTWMAVSQIGSEAYLGLLPVVATLFGASAFAADQRQSQYRFFSEHGVRPRIIWLSRLLVWGLLLATLLAFAWSIQFIRVPMNSRQLENGCIASAFAIAMFAVGQLCSILIRSGIVAVFTAAFCSVLLFLWTMFMVTLGVLWILSALPLPFIFLWASWLYAPKWVQERQTWRVRTLTGATIFVPLLCILGATATYRVLEIPAIRPSFNATRQEVVDSPASRETATIYQEADRLLRSRLSYDSSEEPKAIASRDGEWQKAVELFMAATRRESCRFYNWQDTGSGGAFDGQQLTRAILVEAEVRTESGDLEGAAELHRALLRLARHYYQQSYEANYGIYGTSVEEQLYTAMPDWAEHDALSSDDVKQAVSHLHSWCSTHAPDFEASVIDNHYDTQQFIALNDSIMKQHYGLDTTTRNALRTLGTLLPWERWRMSRLSDIFTEAELQGMREIRARAPRISPQMQQSRPWDVQLTLRNGDRRLLRSTDVEAWLHTTRWLQMSSISFASSYVALERKNEVGRNAVQAQLALIAWRKEHDELPDSLHRLLGNPFESLPTDPYTGQPFVYMPRGVVEEVWDDPSGMMMGGGMGGMMEGGESEIEWEPPKRRLVRSAPFLWSPGEQLRYAPGASRGPLASPVASDFRDQAGVSLSDIDLLYKGVRYPLPEMESAGEESQPSDPADDADTLPNDE